MSSTDCAICEQVRLAREGRFPRLVHEFEHAFLIAGDHQFYPGYCVLIAKDHAREMHDLPDAVSTALWGELMAASRAIESAFKPRKLNLASLGNQVAHAHWHLFPRYESDPAKLANPWANEAAFAGRATTEQDCAELREKLSGFLR